MSITYSGLSVCNYNELTFVVFGDNTATVLVMNLAKPPFNLAFTGVLPTAKVDTRSANTATATVVPNGTGEAVLTITFSTAPLSTVTLGPNVTFIYPSA